LLHIFRLGPVSSSAGAPAYTYVGLVEGGAPRLHEAPTDAAGLEAVRAEALGQPIACEPALAEAGRALGIEAVPLPPAVLKTRAILAYELASGVQHGASKPDAIAALLEGAAAFWKAKSWEVVAPEERLRVAFLEGHAEVDGELSVVGGDGTRLPGVALCDARGALEELARLTGEARAAAALRLANLTIDLEREPGWAAEVIEEGYGLARVPVVGRTRGGAAAPIVTQDLLVAGALLEAIAAWSGIEEEGAVAEGSAEAGGMRVVARVRESERPPAPPAEGLTRVGAEDPSAALPSSFDSGPAARGVRSGGSGRADLEPAGPTTAASPFDSAPVAEPVRVTPSASSRGPSTAAPARPSGGAGRAGSDGWLTRALRALRGERARPGAPAPHAARPARPASKPPARPAPAVTEATEQTDVHPFAPFARALRIDVPAEPAAADEAALAELAARVLEAAQGTAGELVSFPAVALEIVERTHDAKADARSVAGFIARDPALAAEVVSVANSAAFRGVSEIESVHEAVARLGLAEVGRVASAVAARKLLDVPGGAGSAHLGSRFFLRAVAVATAAAGAALRQRGARSDHVWLGGLLHDVGKPLTVRVLARLATAPGAHLTPVALTHRVIDRVHVEVGEAALRRWALPAYLLELCARHHDAAVPAEAVDLHLVRLTSALASLADPEVAARAAREIVQSAGALGVGAPFVRALAVDVEAAEVRMQALVR